MNTNKERIKRALGVETALGRVDDVERFVRRTVKVSK